METFNKCIQTLRNSKSDNEKLASLMVISKITPSIDLTKDTIDELYRAVSSKFLCRLLKSSTQNDENAMMFKQLAVNVLSTVSKVNPGVVVADRELLDCLMENLKAYNGEKQSKTSANTATSNSNFYADLLELLTVLSGAEQGCKYFSQKGIYKIVSTFLATTEEGDNTYEEKAKLLFIQMFKHYSPDMDEHFVAFLREKALAMKSTQELDKFKHLDVLLKLFQIVTDVEWCVEITIDSQYKDILKDVLKSVHDILKSRIKDTFKQKAIRLVAYLFEVFGASWLLDNDITGQNTETLILLLLTSVSIELAFIFSLDRTFTEIIPLTNVITGCVSVEKTLLNCICGDAFAGDELVANDGFIVKVFNSFKTTMSSVYGFLQHVNTDRLDHPIVLEALMMAAVWATEETESLRDELKSVVPLFMKVTRKCLDHAAESMTSNYFAALTPCVAQLLPDKSMRTVLNANHCLQVFQEYGTKLLLSQTKEDKSPEQTAGKSMESLECVIHVFHEFLILEYGYCQSVLWPKTLIDSLVALTMRSLGDSPAISMYSICELVALVLRLHGMAPTQGDYRLKKLLPNALDFLSTLINEVMEYENSLDEIWHVAMQAISDVLVSDKGLCTALKKSYDFESKFPTDRSKCFEKDTAEIINLLKRTVLL